MRAALALLLALCLLSPARADDWSGADTARQAAFLGLLAIDCNQSRAIAQHPDHFREADALARVFQGSKPSVGRINMTCLGGAVAHTAISALLPRPWRESWQWASIGIEAAVVRGNHMISMRASFAF